MITLLILILFVVVVCLVYVSVKAGNTEKTKEPINTTITTKANSSESIKITKEKQVEKTLEQLLNEAFDAAVSVNITTPSPPTEKELNDLIKTAIPDSQGLYPHEILALHRESCSYLDNNDFSYYWFRYKVSDVKAILISLFERGFLKIGDLRHQVSMGGTTNDLKEFLKENGQKQWGSKDELINRIFKTIPENLILERFPKKRYELTEKGELATKEGNYIYEAHKTNEFDIWDINKMYHSDPNLSIKKMRIEKLERDSLKYFASNDFGLYSGTLIELSNLFMKEKKYKDSLLLLFKVVFYQLNCIENNFEKEFLSDYAENFFPYENSFNTIARGIIERIITCQNELIISDIELKSIMSEIFKECKSPIKLFTQTECVKIFFLERDGDTEELEKIYDKAKEKLQKKYPVLNL